MNPNRFAIYFVPGSSEPWAQFCTAWLGWDIETGKAVAHPNLDGFGPVSAITTVPRRYGFHATIKPPFRLRGDRPKQALMRAAADLAANLPSVQITGLQVTAMGRFLALTAQEDTTALNALAASVVRDLDRFRAPPSAQELARRRAANLTPQQETNLRDWGYPHVMDQFRFHMTLTGKLPKDQLTKTHDVLHKTLTPLLPQPLWLTELALVGEDDDGFFHVIDRLPLMDR